MADRAASKNGSVDVMQALITTSPESLLRADIFYRLCGQIVASSSAYQLRVSRGKWAKYLLRALLASVVLGGMALRVVGVPGGAADVVYECTKSALSAVSQELGAGLAHGLLPQQMQLWQQPPGSSGSGSVGQEVVVSLVSSGLVKLILVTIQQQPVYNSSGSVGEEDLGGKKDSKLRFLPAMCYIFQTALTNESQKYAVPSILSTLSSVLAEGTSLTRIQSNQENDAQKALSSMAKSKKLSSAVDTSSGPSSRSMYPFYCLGKDAYAATTGMPAVASRACPMVLGIKGYSVRNQYALLRQALLRAHSMVEHNCLLKEVVCFASTCRQNWALRVTQSASLEEIPDGSHVVVWTYTFHFICLPSAGHIAVCWEALTQRAEKGCLDRFLDEDWFRMQRAMQQLGTHAAFAGHDKISWEACAGSLVYTIHRSEESSAAGMGTLPLSHAHQPPPLCAVKVNCGAAVRVRKEYEAMQRLLHPGRPSAYQALFHVIGCVHFAWDDDIGDLRVDGSAAVNQYARGCLDDNKAFLDGLMATEPCWWMHRSSTAASSSKLSGRLSFTVTVMRSGIPFDVARSAQELGCSDVMGYPWDRSLKWLRDFVHGAGVLHCDCRSPNLMAFLYSKKVVKRLSEQFGQSPCLQGLREYKGTFVDVQVIDFDLSLVCKDEGDTKKNKSIPVVEGAQKTNMARVIMPYTNSSLYSLMSRSELPWNAKYDIQMFWTTLSDMDRDDRRPTISWGQYLLSRFGIKSLSQQVDLSSDDRMVSGHNVPFPLVARKEDQDELTSPLSSASGQQPLPAAPRTKRQAAAIEEGARQSKPKKMKE
eukprot:gene27557-33283_t